MTESAEPSRGGVRKFNSGNVLALGGASAHEGPTRATSAPGSDATLIAGRPRKEKSSTCGGHRSEAPKTQGQASFQRERPMVAVATFAILEWAQGQTRSRCRKARTA